MALNKLPPIEKIPESYSAIADHRVQIYEGYADVISSNYEKQYRVYFHDETYTSNDSATYWQGYPGYPIIAVWLLQGILPYDETCANQFQTIDWNALNIKYKRHYDKALASLYETWVKEGIDVLPLQENITHVYEQLTTLDYTIKRNNEKPMQLK